MPLRFLALALVRLAPSSAAAAELHVLAARAVEKVARETGHAVRFTFGTAGAMQARAAGSDAADLVIVSVPAAEALERQGAVVGGSRVTLGRGRVARLIADAVQAKTSREPDGVRALERVARGEIELAAAPVSEIVAIPGLLVVGRFVAGPAGRARLADAGFEP